MNLLMAGGIQYFMGLDYFTLGWFGWLYFLGFLLIFGYLGLRATDPDPWRTSAKLAGGTSVVALFCAMTSLPSFWSGIIVVIGYILIRKYIVRPYNHAFISSVIFLWILLLIFSLIPAAFGYAFSAFSLMVFYLLSEFDIRSERKRKERESASKGDKEKK